MFRKPILAAAAACLLMPMGALAQMSDSSSSSSADADQKDVASVLSHMPKEIVDCQHHDEAQESADAKLTDTAWDRLKARDVDKLKAMQPQLEAAAAHAPDKPSLPERCGDTLTVYSDNMMDVLLATGVGAGEKDKSGKLNVVQRAPLPYARLDFIVGWLDFEQDKLDAALGWYDRGLKNDPHDPLLASEYANTLSQLGRSADALAFVDKFLADNEDMDDHVRALLLRRRGYALGDLGRHDEAVAAYQDSLKYDPNSDVAKKEMEWNRQRKAVGTSAQASSTPAIYLDGKWIYPGVEVIEPVVQGFAPGQVALDCAVGSDGHLTECDVTAAQPPSAQPGRAIAEVFVKYTRVDPASVPGGIPPGARKKFNYTWR